MTTHPELTPQARLASSRRALVRHMHGDTASEVQDWRAGSDASQDPPPTGPTGSTWQTFKRAAKVWWNHHPAQLALDLARPALGQYAHNKPLQLLGLSALAGAAVVLLRPWRLLSVAGVLGATFKSSEISAAVLSLLSDYPNTTTTPPKDRL